MNAREHLVQIARNAGIQIDGDKPYDIQVHEKKVYETIIANGRLALGETFMDKQWDTQDLATTISKLLKSGAESQLRSPSTIYLALKARLFNLQSKKRAFTVGQEHYDLGNELYGAMLGPTMSYTCADFSSVDNLDDAQIAKFRNICEQLNLKPGMRLLDVGCGWGTFMKYASEHYGVSCVGISVSVEQTSWARDNFGDLPCTIEVVDYRDFNDEVGFDRIVSIEMIEAVGPKNFATYFTKLHSLLKSDGRMFIQAIGDTNPVPTADPWIDKYIFPNGVLPSLAQLEHATRTLFNWDSFVDIGVSYDHTLMSWWSNLEANFSQLRTHNPDKYNERFLRMFKYYLQVCAALARTRNMYVWQMVFSKQN